jgi:hypothetical protein
MFKRLCTILGLQIIGLTVFSQENPVDTLLPISRSSAIDSTQYYHDLFQDLDSFLDSITAPRSYFLASVSLGKGYFNYKSKSTVLLEASQKFTYSPTVAYYHKSGFGFAAAGNIVNDADRMNFFQASLTPSFDYLQNKSFATGVAYARFITKDSLSFYTSPLQNELYGYFTYRRGWIRPTVALSYGWGSRSEYEHREELITSLQLRRRGYIRINTKESISDFSILTSVRHDFYWLDLFAYTDHIRFTPQITFASGTQKFGFNQSSNTYATTLRTGSSVLYNSENIVLDDNLKFQPLSLSLYLRSEYSIGKFFIQPQLVLDYYFPATEENVTSLFSITTGFSF